MYMREERVDSTDQEMGMPPQYDGHLFRPSTEETEHSKESLPKKEEETGLMQSLSRLWDKVPFKDFFNMETVLTALAVWLITRDNDSDDAFFVILLFFLFK